MELSVVRIGEGWVAPCGPTPSGILELSVVDKLPVLRCNARTLHVFRHGPGAAQAIRQALSKALIPYYPLAGKLHLSHQNELQIACTGDGIWLVEASSDSTLVAVNYLDDAMSIPYDKLLPPPPPEADPPPLVQMQVTQFGCEGFVIGLVFCHSICDGLGAAQFLNAVGEMARGEEAPSVAPEWCRSFLPPSPSVPLPLAIPIPDYQLQPAIIDLSIDKIKELKEEFQRERGKRCSTFELVAAMMWRRRTEAIGLQDGETQVKLVFFANTRQLIEPPLPEGFYGNCFFPVSLSARSGELVAKGVLEVVELIQEAKGKLAEEFWKWAKKGGGESESDPFAPPLEYRTLFISEWGRLGFMEVDYGWGRPVHVVPVQGSSIIPVGIVCSQPSPRTGIRLMTWCVTEPHLPRLLHQFQSS